ncbi:uncharacterized protein K444DRAFT_614041 [Hyaloscypha bicolor E]|uniref:Uncharacterized protein n=1 Tax=Hyaloscypha bicolor E TaxID=1095630 RepID=A0A2J6T8I4_9HELO|nr:uncharacterized protein K444DRAFT_614041 [Hyaloscypha bicolor E]PMD59253.1 hypothetical protein K444DRAFT_614041 [Hyaloscypha bicolor E]
MEEARKQKQERIRALKEEIRRWDEDIERLEGLMEEKQIEEQLLGRRRRTENEGGEAKKMVVEHGEIRLAKVGTPMGTRRRGLGAAKQREPSPLSGLRF